MQKPIHRSLAPALLLFAVCSAATLARPSAARADSPPLTPEKPAPQRSACPTDLPGTSIIATSVSDGVDLIFLAPRNASEMRRRVHALSNAQNRATTAGRRAPIAMVYDVDGGAMLKLVPRSPDELADVQGHAIEYAQRLAGEDCSLLRDIPAPDVRKPTSPATVQMPPGIIPGVGGLTAAPILLPSLGAL